MPVDAEDILKVDFADVLDERNTSWFRGWATGTF